MNFFPRGEAVSVKECMKVEVTPLLTFIAPRRSHIVQEDADTQADGWPFRLFPRAHIYSGNRNSPTQSLKKEQVPSPASCSFFLGSRMRWRGGEFSCLGRALRRGEVNLATAVPSPSWATDEGHIWCIQKIQIINFLWCLIRCTFTKCPFTQFFVISGCDNTVMTQC